MNLSTLTLSAFIKVIIDSLKTTSWVPDKFIPFIAIALGIIIYPLSIWDFNISSFVSGALVGSGAIGLNEAENAIKNITLAPVTTAPTVVTPPTTTPTV